LLRAGMALLSSKGRNGHVGSRKACRNVPRAGPLGFALNISGRRPRIVDMAMPAPAGRCRNGSNASRKNVTVDLRRTAISQSDMQNDSAPKVAWSIKRGGITRPTVRRLPVAAASASAAQLAGVPVDSGSTGEQAGLAKTCRPTKFHLYKPHGTGIGLGDPLGKRGARAGKRLLGAAAVVRASLEQEPARHKVDKYRRAASGTRRSTASCANLGTKSSCFAGVNTDQCVLHFSNRRELSRLDAAVLVDDCCATTHRILHGGDDLERQEVFRLRDWFRRLDQVAFLRCRKLSHGGGIRGAK